MVALVVKPLLALVVALTLVTAACGGVTAVEAGSDTTNRSYAGADPAFEFPPGLDWLNTEAPLRIADLRGKVVLLDFWTYGCINCIHVIPDLKRLEAEFADELVVIGVHSAKFDNEGETENIRRVIRRYDVRHPVVNDRDFTVWRTWGVRAWPTLVAIDPAGNIVGARSGEGVYAAFEPIVAGLVKEFDARGEIDRSPLALRLEQDRAPGSVLSFPGKVLADPDRGRLFVADTANHRIVIADLESGEIIGVAGSGGAGFEDGGFGAARFDQPQGMALDAAGSVLFVADTGNHSIRRVDLEREEVTTLLGTGYQATTYPPNPGIGPGLSLSSPWDVLADGETLYIAMAGSHQIWSLDIGSGLAGPVAGSGREGVINGPAYAAQLAQPSGLARDGSLLFFADSESSAIRAVDLAADTTSLVAGSDRNLFSFGDVDGAGPEALLQHPLGVAVGDGLLFVADTYNNKLKRYDPATGIIETIAGGDRGWADGPDPRFYEPGGIDFAAGLLYVADTNNHAIRVVDPATGAARTLVLYGIERFEARGDGYLGLQVTMEPVVVAPGEVELIVEVAFPAGYKVNDQAPFSMEWIVEGGVAVPGPGAERRVVAPVFPQTAIAAFSAGSGSITADLTVYYCTEEAESLCLIEQVRVTVPVEVAPGGAVTVRFPYTIVPPEL